MTVQRDFEAADFTELWIDDELLDEGRSPSFPPDSLVTFRYIWAAVLRHAGLWAAVALAGLTVGLVIPLVLPADSVSSAKVLLTHRDGEDPVRAMATDMGLVHTHTVADLVIGQLGLSMTSDELLDRYTATDLTDRVMEIVATAPTTQQAVELADAVATAYLPFREELVAQHGEKLHEQLAQADEEVAAARAAVVAAGYDPDDTDPPPTPERIRLTAAREQLQFIEQQLLDHQVAATRMSTSRVLDAAAPVPQSALKQLAISSASGLIAGLALGLGFVVVRAMLSDRLWTRRDIARALGADIRLSVGRLPRWHWRLFPGHLAGSRLRRPELQHVTRHLRSILHRGGSPKPALVVVGVDNAKPSTLIVTCLAMTLARKGKRVFVADMSGGVLAAGLGLTGEGTHEVKLGDSRQSVTVHVPPADGSQAPVRGGAAADDAALDDAWTAAEVVLTLATLSPSVGAEHLRPWASDAAVVVTAGRSSAARLHATGEMIRLAGIRLDSAVVVRADRTDDSLGVLDADAALPDTGPTPR